MIITDGYENSSCQFCYEEIKQMIEDQKKQYGWEFVFLGANIDAVAEAKRFGIDEQMAVNYNSDKEGTALNFEVMGEFTERLCSEFIVPHFLLNKIRDDYKTRGRK